MSNKMKCDELKEYKAYEFGTSYVYSILEVREAIAELKARIQLDDDEMAGFLQLEEECGGGDLRNYIAELKNKLEDVQASAYADSIDSGMEKNRLKRALWLARVERASDRARIFYFSDLDMILDIDGYSYDKTKSSNCKKDTARNWRITWLKVERKCLEKAEEYK